MKQKPPNEKQITQQIRQFLNMKRIFHWKVRQGLGCVPGVPDIIGVMPKTGQLLAIEVKTEKGKMDKKGNQERFINNLQKDGAICFIARSVQDVIDNLKPYW